MKGTDRGMYKSKSTILNNRETQDAILPKMIMFAASIEI